MKESAASERVDLKELNFTILAETSSKPRCVKFRVYDIVGYNELNGQPIWPSSGSNGPSDMAYDLREAEIFLHGTVKWDGCSDWWFDEQDRNWIHGCCKEDIERFGKVLAYCWDWANTALGID